MGCRRKTKSERELVADIRKRFEIFCKGQECHSCPYGDCPDKKCIIVYVKDILDLFDEEEDE